MGTRGKDLDQLLKELKESYLKALPQKIEILQGHIKDQNWDQVVEESHKLKGTGRTYGFPEVTRVASRIEDLAEDQSTRLEAQFEPALKLLEEMKKSYASGSTAFDLSQNPLVQILKINLLEEDN